VFDDPIVVTVPTVVIVPEPTVFTSSISTLPEPDCTIYLISNNIITCFIDIISSFSTIELSLL
jgi:hypothetical protein